MDQRIKAAINMDGTIWGDLAGPWPRSVLAAAGHNDFSDMKLLAKHYVPDAPPQDLQAQGLGTIDAMEALRFTRTRTLSFFASYLQP